MPSCSVGRYPQWVNQPAASDAETVVSAYSRATCNASWVLAPARRKAALILEKASSMGERSGEYAGKKGRSRAISFEKCISLRIPVGSICPRTPRSCTFMCLKTWVLCCLNELIKPISAHVKLTPNLTPTPPNCSVQSQTK